MTMIRTIIADDYALIREGIVSLLADVDDIEVVGEAENGIEALKLLHEKSPDVAVVDVSMPKLTGIDIVEKLNKCVPIVIISAHDDEKLVQKTIQAGAYGFVVKDAATEELLLAIRSAYKKHTFISPRISQAILETCFPKRTASLNNKRLTPREHEVLKMVTAGDTNGQIAQSLGISIKTVEKHRRKCMDKLGVDNLPSLIQEAVRQRLVMIDEHI